MAPVRRVVAPVVMGAALAAMSATGVLAQSREMHELLMRLDRVQRELTTLQRHVYQGAPPPSRSGATMPISGAAETQAAARIEVRLTQLETELRDLTGRIEETQHAIRQVDERLKKLATDVEYRISALEKAKGAPGPAAATGAGAAPAASAATQGGATQGGAPKAIPPRSLGEIPKSAAAEPAPEATSGQQAAAVRTAAEAAPEQQYEQAIDLMQAQRFSEAERALRSFIDANPDSALQDNAHYWLGETYYARRDYQRAAYAFADGFQKYPEGGKAADSLLKLGMSLGRLGKEKEACTAFSRLLEHFPDANGTIRSRVSREQRSYGCH